MSIVRSTRTTTLADQVNRMCLADTRLFLPGLNLAYTDRASMAASTEVRVPFVDTEVVRAAFSLPGSAKMHHRSGKVVLKEVAERFLPNEIVYRPKASFSAPLTRLGHATTCARSSTTCFCPVSSCRRDFSARLPWIASSAMSAPGRRTAQSRFGSF